MQEEGSEVKRESDHLEGRQVSVWSHHSDGQRRNLKMEDILSHPLGPLPWALSTHDGLLTKTNKATLATTLQKNVAVAEQFPGNSASG